MALSRRSVHGLLGNSCVREMEAAVLNDELKIVVCCRCEFFARGGNSTYAQSPCQIRINPSVLAALSYRALTCTSQDSSSFCGSTPHPIAFPAHRREI
jgi:hypothetical protein